MTVRYRAGLMLAAVTLSSVLVAACGGGEDDDTRAAARTAEGGSVSVTVGSGPLAGTHEGSGGLSCGHGKFGGDEVWLVFSTDIDEANDLTVLNVYSAPEGEKDNIQSPYRGQAFVLDVGVGNFMADASKKLTINGDHPGTQGVRKVDGNTIRVAGTTGDGVEVQVEAHCAYVEQS